MLPYTQGCSGPKIETIAIFTNLQVKFVYNFNPSLNVCPIATATKFLQRRISRRILLFFMLSDRTLTQYYSLINSYYVLYKALPSCLQGECYVTVMYAERQQGRRYSPSSGQKNVFWCTFAFTNALYFHLIDVLTNTDGIPWLTPPLKPTTNILFFSNYILF